MTGKRLRKNVDSAYGTNSLGIFQTKASLRGMQKKHQMGPKTFFGDFSRVPLLDATFDIPRSMHVCGIPMELLPDALSIFSLIFWPSFLSLQDQ